ncbi:MAG: N-acetyltransferase family protein [Halobacteriota archaeon]
MNVRPARHDDYESIAAFTSEVWADRGVDNYIPRIYHDWIDGDGDSQRTLVVDASADGEREVDDGERETDDGGDIAAIGQCVLLSEWEAWLQGMRVDPAYRELGVATRLTHDLFDWARTRGAVVARNMIFSWNAPSLGLSRAAGFAPETEFRWATPTPDPEATPELRVTADPDGGWAFWTRSDTRTALRGLALDDDETWALSELTREHLHDASAEGRLLTVQDGGTRALALRTRTVDRESEVGAPETLAEYGVGAWADTEAGAALFRAVARDAAAVDADRARVLIPESPQFVTDAAAARVGLADEPDFVMAADLTDESLLPTD